MNAIVSILSATVALMGVGMLFYIRENNKDLQDVDRRLKNRVLKDDLTGMSAFGTGDREMKLLGNQVRHNDARIREIYKEIGDRGIASRDGRESRSASGLMRTVEQVDLLHKEVTTLKETVGSMGDYTFELHDPYAFGRMFSTHNKPSGLVARVHDLEKHSESRVVHPELLEKDRQLKKVAKHEKKAGEIK